MEDNKVLNMSIYVEGGPIPVLHSFAKNTASIADINYPHTLGVFSQNSYKDEDSESKSFIASKKGDTVGTSSVFEITTAGGARYTQMIDVCYDHARFHSSTILQHRFARKEQLVPEQVEQCVTSNSITVKPEASVSTVVLQADPELSMIEFHGASPERSRLTERQLG